MSNKIFTGYLDMNGNKVFFGDTINIVHQFNGIHDFIGECVVEMTFKLVPVVATNKAPVNNATYLCKQPIHKQKCNACRRVWFREHMKGRLKEYIDKCPSCNFVNNYKSEDVYDCNAELVRKEKGEDDGTSKL